MVVVKVEMAVAMIHDGCRVEICVWLRFVRMTHCVLGL